MAPKAEKSSKGTVFNLIIIVSAMFLAASIKNRSEGKYKFGKDSKRTTLSCFRRIVREQGSSQIQSKYTLKLSPDHQIQKRSL